jgi:hypothetical protein
MKAITMILAGGVGMAALAAAAPAAAQYYPGYGYGYGSPYGGNPVGQVLNQVLGGGNYGYGANSQVAVNQCANAVQARLGGGYGYGYGYGYGAAGRVLGISRVEPRNGGLVVRGVATSGRYGYNYGGQPPVDLTWRCRVDYRGFVTGVDINRAERNYGVNYTPWNDDYSQYGYRRY